ncbi:MAG: PepSY domain-containing protein [Eubacteriaceae bacterium]|nr:PepSY domain-containing protein [Eubacteriaceae bacterium]
MNIKTTVINNKKKILTAGLAILVTAAAVFGTMTIVKASTSSSMKKIAQTKVPSTAAFKDIDSEHGSYELEYYDKTNNESYDVTINKKTKKVTSVERDYSGTKKTGAAASNKGLITEKKAESIVLKSLSGATVTDMELESSSTAPYYEGSATLGTTEYEFEIDAASGKITKWDKDSVDHDGEDHDDGGHDD